jgi:hypothetical protein
MRKRAIPLLLLLAACATALAAAEKTKDAADATLIGGHLHYTPPPDEDWQRAENVNGDESVAFARRDHQGAIAMQVLPADAEMTPGMGPAIIRSLRDTHKKADQKILYGPKIEPDKRFALKVHEKYQSGEKVADELHIYRNVGPRVVMVTVNAWLSDESGVKQIHKAGEDVLVSAKWSGGAKK